MSDVKKAKKPHLGRGLEALLGPINLSEPVEIAPPAASSENRFPPDPLIKQPPTTLDLTLLRANPYQPRKTWNRSELEELANSIRANGVIQPVIVRKVNDIQYEIIAGERRVRASQMAGLKEVPVIVRSATDEQMLELALVENIHRSDLNPIERAKAYQNFVQTFSLNQTEAAERLGENRSVVSNFLRLLDLPTDLQDMLIEGQLTMGHARALLSLPTDEMRRKLANRAMAGRLSVREVERMVRMIIEGQQKTPQEKKSKAAYIVDLETRLQTILGTKVKIEPNKRGQRGRIVIDYYSLDEFERLTDRIGLRKEEM